MYNDRLKITFSKYVYPKLVHYLLSRKILTTFLTKKSIKKWSKTGHIKTIYITDTILTLIWWIFIYLSKWEKMRLKFCSKDFVPLVLWRKCINTVISYSGNLITLLHNDNKWNTIKKLNVLLSSATSYICVPKLKSFWLIKSNQFCFQRSLL